jgi:hypothetical protein
MIGYLIERVDRTNLIQTAIQAVPSVFYREKNLNSSAKMASGDLSLQDNIIITSESKITSGLRLKKPVDDFFVRSFVD